MKVIAVIPARGGSKGIPQKNIRSLMGHPLIGYSIKSSLGSSLISRTIISSDSEEIIDIAMRYGAEAPFVRPAEFACDDSLDLPVFQHCLEWLKKNEGYIPDIVVHLRPTSPIRSSEYIDESIRLLQNSPDASCVRSVSVPENNPYKMWQRASGGFLAPLLSSELSEAYNMPRDLLPEVLWQNGNIDTIRASVIRNEDSMTGKNILPLVMKDYFGCDIDTELSWMLSEHILKQKPEIIEELFNVRC